MGSTARPVSGWLALLSERVTRHRLNQDLSQASLALRSGISLRTLARLEAGEPVQLESFLRVLIALGLEGCIESWVPDLPESPIQQLERGGQARQRASRRTSAGQSRKVPRDWRWEEDS